MRLIKYQLNNMSEQYKLKIAGLERILPIIKIEDKLSIASFVMLGDTELN